MVLLKLDESLTLSLPRLKKLIVKTKELADESEKHWKEKDQEMQIIVNRILTSRQAVFDRNNKIFKYTMNELKEWMTNEEDDIVAETKSLRRSKIRKRNRLKSLRNTKDVIDDAIETIRDSYESCLTSSELRKMIDNILAVKSDSKLATVMDDYQKDMTEIKDGLQSIKETVQTLAEGTATPDKTVEDSKDVDEFLADFLKQHGIVYEEEPVKVQKVKVKVAEELV